MAAAGTVTLPPSHRKVTLVLSKVADLTLCRSIRVASHRVV
jgi:hypothetical protein